MRICRCLAVSRVRPSSLGAQSGVNPDIIANVIIDWLKLRLAE